MTSSSSSSSGSDSSEEEKKKKEEESSDSDSDSDSESSSEEKKKKKKKEKKAKKKKDKKKDKKGKKKKEKKGKKDKDKKKKKEKGKKPKKKKPNSMSGAVSNQYGKFGILKPEDFFNKKPEFLLWASEVKKTNTDVLGQMQQRDLFKEYIEDYNTATMPSKKYYNIQAFEMEAARRKKAKNADKEQEERERNSIVSFDDEASRRQEVAAMKARKAENLVKDEVNALRMNKEKAEAMKAQNILRTQAEMLNRVGHSGAASKINDRLNPNKIDFAERRARKKDGPVGFQPEG
eukprot:TRINITY_DN20581_c0_g1_i1.p1 TRINITY_DN20581_c0_g1~~TRINITY_DN20581_c0_g1_i1.p1  ORF type:complete len:290 (+),score=109.16 TRINITY_DN20581_c0_g1_i1:61-930(+)